MRSGVRSVVSAVLILGALGLAAHFWRGRNPADPSLPSTARIQGKVLEQPLEALPPEAAAPQGNGGRIGGRIILDGSRAPAARARVSAVPVQPRGAPIETVAGDDGRYTFQGLTPGSYQVFADLPGWTCDLANLARSPPIEVQPAESMAGVDRILFPGAMLGGDVVEAATGLPIARAEIRLRDQLLARTGDDGRFFAETVPEGPIEVGVLAPGFGRRWIQTETRAGAENAIRFELHPAGIIRGTVTGADGRPVPGAMVFCILGQSGMGWGDLLVETLTDRRGRYALAGIPLTERSIVVLASFEGLEAVAEAGGFPPESGELSLDLRFEEDRRVSMTGRVVDPSGETIRGAMIYTDRSGCWEAISDEEGAFRLDRGREPITRITAFHSGNAPRTLDIRGLPFEKRNPVEVVLEESHFLSGRIVGPSGRPVEGAMVYPSLADRATESFPGIPPSATDAEGRFRLQDLPAGEISVDVVRKGFRELLSDDLAVDQEDVELTIKEARRVVGIVVEKETGHPVLRFMVDAPDVDRMSFESPDGSFLLTERENWTDEINVHVLESGFLPGESEAVHPWASSEDHPPVRIELERGESVRGQVVSASTGNAIPGVLVDWRDQFMIVTDREGMFSIDGCSQEGTRFSLKKAGYGETSFQEVLPSPEVQEFRLPPESAIEGTLRNSLPGTSVKAFINSTDYWGRVDPGGHYRIDGLPAGEATVEVASELGPGRKRSFDLAEGQVAVADFEFGEGGIRGMLIQRGAPAKRGCLVIKKHHDPEVDGFIWAENGYYELGGLTPGTYALSASATSLRGCDFAEDLRVEVGQDWVVCNYTLPSAAVSGRVMGSARSNVCLYRMNPWHRWAMYASQQLSGETFEFEGIPPGTYLATHRQRWVGPFEVGDSSIEGLVIPTHGDAKLLLEPVNDRDKSPVEKATAFLSLTETISLREDGVQGEINFEKVQPGPYRLRITANGFKEFVEDIEVGPELTSKIVALDPEE